ncbi:lantibiotic dehydratase family protein [Tenacibaculum ovolyticum]|uniref:lantibiotic dehydratase family protein n=1 Tax=Tenacibaculum ovolyticum TaxID=104270 RepID=UPI003BAB465C
MKKKNPYQAFDNYILRTPLLSLSEYISSTSEEKISEEKIKEYCDVPEINEAIFLASPSLHSEIKRWKKGEIKDVIKREKLKYSVLKYFSRMTSRCTPFGLFAGCTIGKFENENDIRLNDIDKHFRYTRLDMSFLVALSQNLIKNKEIKKQLLFYPNSSLYKIDNKIRYVEYYYKDSKRFHDVVAVDDSVYLSKLITKASSGAYINELVGLLVDEKISKEDAFTFVNDLVSNQIFISELEPSVSGDEFMSQIINVLRKLKGTERILLILNEIQAKLKEIDLLIGNHEEKYIELSNIVKKLNIDFQLKFLFQNDLVLKTQKNFLDKKLVASIKKGMALFNKITLAPQDTFLTNFRDSFYERYETREVSLSKVLDVETGIGYKQNFNSGDINSLIDGLPLPSLRNGLPVQNLKWTEINTFFQKKIRNTIKEDLYILKLTEQDFKNFECNWDDLPDTISYMVEVIDEEEIQKIRFKGGGGSSAANLFGRFCHGDKQLYEYTKKIIETEKEINVDKILAEIVHLPESRVGNVLMRPSFREYEIPYLAKSLKKKDKQINLDDLMISVVDNQKILLRSKSKNKEVIPHLTNAHNFSNNSLPVYHFLSDMQMQGIRGGLGFNLGPFADSYEFLPRIEYLDLIVHDATWNLSKQHIEPILSVINNDDEFLNEVKIFRKKMKIPNYVMLTDGDNELLINFNNITSSRMLFETVKKRARFKLTEFLFNESNCIVKDINGAKYTNQIIVSFFNKEKAEKKVL